mmetsp:Transcript_23833/g.61890  ORF Transcript_23833/g.61890 Transcript_23833/m.61890 type:complete len:295 (+) Transcript_23833:3818-4702(+)
MSWSPGHGGPSAASSTFARGGGLRRVPSSTGPSPSAMLRSKAARVPRLMGLLRTIQSRRFSRMALSAVMGAITTARPMAAQCSSQKVDSWAALSSSAGTAAMSARNCSAGEAASTALADSTSGTIDISRAPKLSRYAWSTARSRGWLATTSRGLAPLATWGSIGPCLSRVIVNQKVLPWPGLLWMPMLPFIMPTSCLQMASPRPVPPKRRVVLASACVKRLNNLACAAFEIPMPLSVTLTRRLTWLSVSMVSFSQLTTISPDLVNLTALESRLSRICLMRPLSPRRRVLISGSM